MAISGLSSLADVPEITELGVIINVATPRVTLLALHSACRYLQIPLLLIECSTGRDAVDLTSLETADDVYVVRAQRRPHGAMLDALFRCVRAPMVYLIDSDIEFLAPDAFDQMRVEMADRSAFGSGMMHAASWLPAAGAPYGYYVERMWLPFCGLRTRYVRAALDAGESFLHRRQPNDVAASEALSWLLMWRWRLPLFNHCSLNFLSRYRCEAYGVKAGFYYFDTGAQLYQSLLRKQLCYHALDASIMAISVKHFHGVTRRRISLLDRTGTAQTSLECYVSARLAEHYGVNKTHMDTRPACRHL